MSNFSPFILREIDYQWVVTACWDGQNRRIRFWCRTQAEAWGWYRWSLDKEPESNPEMMSYKQWFERRKDEQS